MPTPDHLILRELLARDPGDGRNGAPGRVLGSFTVACGSGAVEITEAQREGKRSMLAAEVLRGYALQLGQALQAAG